MIYYRPIMPKLSAAEEQIFAAIKDKDINKVRSIISSNERINLNCMDEDELTPLQHACHTGNYELAKLLIDLGADVNFTGRQDGYTPLMFAALGNREPIVRMLLEHGVDTKVENCVYRTAAQMAAFVSCQRVVTLMNNWILYKESVEPYTRCRELEDKPRLELPRLGRTLHDYIVYPYLHPVKLLFYIRDNRDLVEYAQSFIYVLENLSSKMIKPPTNDESQALRLHYLAYLIEHCRKNQPKSIDSLVRQLIKREYVKDTFYNTTPQIDHFIMECLMKFPYTQSAIFKTLTYALTRRGPDEFNALNVLFQTLNGPRMYAAPAEACIVCVGSERTRRCSRCKSVYYCDPSCQKADWFQHKKDCTE